MRTSDQRVEELHLRMNERRRTKLRRTRIVSVLILCLCLGVSTAFSVWVAGVPRRSGDTADNLSAASIISNNAVGGYAAVALLAFGLGVLATILCQRLKKRRDEEGRPNDRTD